VYGKRKGRGFLELLGFQKLWIPQTGSSTAEITIPTPRHFDLEQDKWVVSEGIEYYVGKSVVDAEKVGGRHYISKDGRASHVQVNPDSTVVDERALKHITEDRGFRRS